jgi:KUP system potassium uptake protein
MLLELGKPIQHPLFHLVPAGVLPWLVMLATAATVIASQATISGAFSMASQAVHLDLLPRLRVLQTSALEQGQIYVPIVNWFLMVGSVGLVLTLRSSSAMGGMYGMAVIGAMLPVSFHFYISARHVLGWSRWSAGPAVALFLLVDGAMLAASLPRLAQGAWLPLAVGIAVVAVMGGWNDGMSALRRAHSGSGTPLPDFVRRTETLPRLPGAGVFFSAAEGIAPHALMALSRLKHALLETSLVVTIVADAVPRAEPARNLVLTRHGRGIFAAQVRRGFMEHAYLMEAVAACAAQGVPINPATCVFWVRRDEFAPSQAFGPTAGKLFLFAALSRTAQRQAVRMGLPPDHTVEIGVETDLSDPTRTQIRRY